MWNGVYVWVKSLNYSPLETDWENTLLGHKVELEWRLKVFPSTYNHFFFLNFTAPKYAILFLNSKIYIVHVINHEWNRSRFVASAVCFVWDTKLDFPIVKVDVFSLVLMFIFFHCLYMFSVFVLVSQTLMWLLIMIVIDDEVIHFDITVSL